MKDLLYIFRVLFISFEMIILLLGGAAWWLWLPQFNDIASVIHLNDEINKYLMLLPAGLAVWIFNEVRCLLQEDKDTLRLLLRWEDYWKLKCHAWVSLCYAVVFVCISLVPWVSKSGIATGGGILLFLVGVVGQLYVAVSVYLARIKVKEIVVSAGA